jgi:hypothetical protein
MAGGSLAPPLPSPSPPHTDEEDVKGVEEDQGGNAESDAAALKAVIEETDRNISGWAAIAMLVAPCQRRRRRSAVLTAALPQQSD